MKHLSVNMKNKFVMVIQVKVCLNKKSCALIRQFDTN